MRKFLLHMVLFVLLTAMAYVLLVFLSGQFLPERARPNLRFRIGQSGHLFSRLAEVKGKTDIDLLFLGSSHAYRGFDTRQYNHLNLESFNLGSSSQTPLQTKVLLERYLDQLNPEIVVYEVYPEVFSSDGVESSLEMLANDENDLHSLKMAMQTKNIKPVNFWIYGKGRDLFHLNDSLYEPAVKRLDTYIPGGFVERVVSYNQETVFEPKPIEFTEQQWEIFQDIMREFEERDIRVVLVYAPIPPSNYRSYTNNAYFDSLMSSKAEYINFNEVLQTHDTLHFYDGHHMNQLGVEVFNEALIERVFK